MTTMPPIPFRPRLGARAAYRLQPALRPRAALSCEVYPERRCVWVEAYERAAAQGRADDLRLLHRPADHRRWGQSSWLNYWQGRDEGLWTGDATRGATQKASR
jgi:Methylene-tetrahydrofolate reductase C terminal